MSPAAFTPLFSVIVPVYRAEAYLERCVASLLKQSYPHLDIILVEDGSPDNSGALCDALATKDKRIRVIHQSNAGASTARNRGIDAAKGDWLCFVDADDYVDPDYIFHFVSGLGEEVDLVFQGMCAIGKEGITRKIPQSRLYTQTQLSEAIADINRHAMFGYVWNKLFRKSIITAHGLQFRQDISLSEDRIFALEYLRHARKMRVVEAAAYYYVPHAEGLTMRRRSYAELKTAAEANLTAALDLLKKCPSERFQKDTQRMYVSCAVGFLNAMFRNGCSYNTAAAAISDFNAKARGWFPLYRPISSEQRWLCLALKLPIFLSIAMMRSYWYLKKKKHEIFA